MSAKVTSDGSTASYYELPEGATELQHLIGHRNMNAQIGEIFRACYRYGLVEHSPEIRDIKKILFYAKAELERLEKLNAPGAPRSFLGWIDHDGRPLPPDIHDEMQVEVQFRHGGKHVGTVAQYYWYWRAATPVPWKSDSYDIVRYRFL